MIVGALRLVESAEDAMPKSAPEYTANDVIMINEDDLPYTQRSVRKRARSLEDTRTGTNEEVVALTSACARRQHRC